jgi:hypothetical protein
MHESFTDFAEIEWQRVLEAVLKFLTAVGFVGFVGASSGNFRSGAFGDSYGPTGTFL